MTLALIMNTIATSAFTTNSIQNQGSQSDTRPWSLSLRIAFRFFFCFLFLLLLDPQVKTSFTLSWPYRFARPESATQCVGVCDQMGRCPGGWPRNHRGRKRQQRYDLCLGEHGLLRRNRSSRHSAVELAGPKTTALCTRSPVSAAVDPTQSRPANAGICLRQIFTDNSATLARPIW